MKAILEAPVKLWNIAVFAEIAVWEPRPEIHRLCAAVAAAGLLDEGLVNQRLPGISPQGRRNVLQHVTYLRLRDDGGRLTGFGQACARTGRAPAWEQGVFDILVASHDLFGGLVLDFKRTESDPRDADYQSLESLPRWLVPDAMEMHESVVEKGKWFSVAGFPSSKGQAPMCRGELLPPGRLVWEIDPLSGKNSWRVEGKVGSEGRTFRSAMRSEGESRLAGLFKSWEPQWDDRRQRVVQKYDGAARLGGRDDFIRTRKYARVAVPGAGEFADVVVEGVPVAPAALTDAQIWATVLTVGRVEEGAQYVSPDAWRAAWAASINATPLADVAGAPADPVAVAMDDSTPMLARTRWLLSAASDLMVEV